MRAAGDKLVAAADKSAVNRRLLRLDAHGRLKELRVGFIIEWQSLHLSEFRLRSAVHVMVGHAFSGHDVHHLQAIVNPSSNARIDQGVGVVAVNQFHGADSGIYFADAALHQNDFAAVENTFHECETAFFYCAGI